MKAADPFTGGRMAPPATVELRGPADADHFRVAVGRYNDRWYCDPLPGCDIAPAWEGTAPSVSTVKKASGSDWSFVALKRVADAIDTPQYARLDQQAHDHRYEALKAINKLGLSAAAQRGTNVHLMAEARLYGRPCPITDNMPGAEYRGAVDAFFDQYQPELVAAEFVCINRTLNGVGYGGTADALLRIDGKVYGTDWKSRGAESQHGAYPEEAAQEGAYFVGADYIIAEGANGPERRPMPVLAGGLIVSIKPDGARVYPVDLDAGFEHFASLHAWWVARRDERKAIGRQWTPRKTVTADSSPLSAVTHDPAAPGLPPPVEQQEAGAVSSAAPASLSLAADEPTSADKELSPLRQAQEARKRIDATADAKRRLHDTPDEGADSDERTFAVLRRRYDDLTDAQRSWIAHLGREAEAAKVGFSSKTAKTQRRFEILRGLVVLAARSESDDQVRQWLALVDPRIEQLGSVPLGHIVGSLSAQEAATFAQLVTDELQVVIDDNGNSTLAPAAA